MQGGGPKADEISLIVRTSFAEGPAYQGRLFRYDGQVRACGRVGLTALLPLLQYALADAIGS